MTDLPIPVADDADTGGFWEASAEGDVRVRRCDACAAVLHLPKVYCHRCGSWDSSWHDVRPTGRSTRGRRRTGNCGRVSPRPYTVVLVDLADAPEAPAWSATCQASQSPADGNASGCPVEQRGDATLVQWVPA